MLTIPGDNYDVVGSVVLHKTAPLEVQHTISQFSAISSASNLKVHLCVVDNSPIPLEMDCLNMPGVSYCFTNRNLGYGRAHNIALRASQGKTKYSLVMNTDITYSPEVIIELKKFLDSCPNAGLAAPRILYPDGNLQYVCRLLPTPLNVFFRRFFPKSKWTKRLDSNYELRWWDHSGVASLPFISGCFLLLRTDLCQLVGGFDERFFLYAEDVDLCRKIHQLADTVYVPDVSIVHDYRRKNKHSWLATCYAIYSHWQYFNKWGWVFDKSRQEINLRTLRQFQHNSVANKVVSK